MTTDLKFFTNEPERDLYSRFSTILKSNTQFFDVLVGYFRSSGFFKLYESLLNVEKIRILVGLNVDKFTVKIIDQANGEAKLTSISSKEGREILQAEVEKEFVQADATSEVEKGVRIFIEWLKSGKLEMRMYTAAPIHAKVYIMRKDPEKVPDMFGSVITGSSNFSEAGLLNNLEFNVELKDSSDVQFALDRFEDLWKKSVEINETYIEAIEEKTWLKEDITPYQLYLKTLYEFFKEEINSDKDNIEALLPDGYMKLQYQLDAVTQARKKLEAYNGVFISDVVGLGKTYICALLANSFKRNTYKLFICPPVLKDYWESVLKDFDVARCDVESLGKLDQVVEKGIDKYSYVFIDEAHRFRNSNTDAFTYLHEICRGKKVILISATPINNYTTDIENQLYLFQAKQSGNINGIKNLEGFFRNLNSKLNKIPKGTDNYRKQLRENSEIIRDRLLREVMIRRTRSEVKQYYAEDLKKQGLSFPSVGSPERIVYEFDEQTDEAFRETMGVIKDFSYARYTPLIYLKDKTKYANMLVAQKNMGGFMKGILVKRLESSFYAFKMTLSRFIDSYEKFIEMFRNGNVYISKKVDVYDLLDDGDTTKLLYYVEQQDVMHFKSNEFEAKYIRLLERDLAELKALKDIWDPIKDDPKLDIFKKYLRENPSMKGKKVIVFTESTETAEYLKINLKDVYGNRLISFSGQGSSIQKSIIEDSFNPKYKDKNNDKYDLLITTDVLAEGVNLHRSNVLVNYDLPWNPTRIMQRVGRVNRVGTEHDRIYVFNFFPTAQSAAQMPLEERILEKLQSFHDTLGEDYKYLSDEEEVSPQKLFADLNKNIDADEEESINPELAYLTKIREIRDKDEKLFTLIKRLPLKAKTGRQFNQPCDSTLTFIRKGAFKCFFETGLNEPKQLSFIEAIKKIECKPDEKKVSITGKYFDHLKVNSAAFDNFVAQEDEISSQSVMIAGNDAKIIKMLKAIKSDSRLTDEQESDLDILITRWENGEIPSKVSKDIVKLSKLATDSVTLYYDIIREVPELYFRENSFLNSNEKAEKEIILSCYLKGAKE